tara:strand:- start:846 stop:1199 length:354 start_codon:yes stop_codon:yes gene_type:complete
MKKVLTLFLLIFSIVLFAQDKSTKVAFSKNIDSKITSLKYTTSSINEFETINWQDVKSIFETNKPEEKIEMTFEIDLKESKDKFKSSVTVGGKTEEIDSLIKRAKKIIKSIIKISKK